jgi:hypothetical protein
MQCVFLNIQHLYNGRHLYNTAQTMAEQHHTQHNTQTIAMGQAFKLAGVFTAQHSYL